ncbi:MAG: GTPase [Alphaproteobacteria bacterium]|nr:GTPase [Alphaproteobacteria bacterium]NDC56020.1 GTPase [Alphaproteobacteria bacterium]NDG04915.1 GTPase [Alphaproteobacteria bacterium]
MRLKSFHAGTLSEAMKMVREALGDDAIIVATRDDEQGGVRVTAALDDDAKPATETPAAAPSAKQTDENVIDRLASHLYRHGVTAALSEKLLATAMHYSGDDASLALAAACDAHLKFKPLFQTADRKPIIFVGPPGAGKTLSTAKIATQAKIQNKPVCVMTTDTIRAGGVEQLSSFTKLLKVPLLQIEDTNALKDALSVHQNDMVIIDTAGRNPFDAADLRELKSILGTAALTITMVLPASYDTQDGAEIAAIFKELGAGSLLITRVDMARRLGSMLNICHLAGIPLAALSRSSNVTEPLEILNPVLLAKLLLSPPLLPHHNTMREAKRA